MKQHHIRCDNSVTCRNADKKFELKGDLSKMITNENYPNYLAKLSDRKLFFEFAKEMYFYGKLVGYKSERVNSLNKSLLSSVAMKGTLIKT